MIDTADSLLHELVEILGERPYQARDLRGPFDCVFCGGVTENELHPEHEAECPWPRVLAVVGFEPRDRSPHEAAAPRKLNPPANER